VETNLLAGYVVTKSRQLAYYFLQLFEEVLVPATSFNLVLSHASSPFGYTSLHRQQASQRLVAEETNLLAGYVVTKPGQLSFVENTPLGN
jgi:hypothetical protein